MGRNFRFLCISTGSLFCSQRLSLVAFTVVSCAAGWGGTQAVGACMRRAAIGYTACVLPGRLMAGRQTLDLVVVVRIHPRVIPYNLSHTHST